jgi:hypothetical protein
VVSDGTNFVQSGGISGVISIPGGGTGATTAYGAATNLGVPQWSVGVGAPSATCSAIANNGTFYTSSTSEIFQCSNVTGTYQWNQLGPTLNCAAASVYSNILCYGGIADLQPSFGYMSFGWSSGGYAVNVTGSLDGYSWNFTSADVGKYISFNKNSGAWTGGLPFVANSITTANTAKIASVIDATHFTVDRQFQTTDTAYGIWGTDNTPAAHACYTAVVQGNGGTCAWLAGHYMLATYDHDANGNVVYAYGGLAQDSGDYQTNAGGSGATVSCTTVSGHLNACTVTGGGTNYPASNTEILDFGQSASSWLGCPTIYAGPCGGEFATVTTNSSGHVQNPVTIIYAGFGLTGTVAPNVIPTGGDGEAATCSLTGGTCGTPTITNAGGGHPTSQTNFLAIHAFNAGGSTCSTVGGYAGTNFVGVGTASSNSSGGISSAVWTTAPTGCGSVAPTIVFGPFACWDSGTSKFDAQCTNLSPLIPPAIPIQVALVSGASTFAPTGSALQGASVFSTWDGVTVDTPTPGVLQTQSAMFGGPYSREDVGNLEIDSGFIGLWVTNNASRGNQHDMVFATGIGILSASTDLGLKVSNLEFDSGAPYVNGGTWSHRSDFPVGAGGINDFEGFDNMVVEPSAYNSVYANLDTWFDKAVWHSDFTGDAVDMPETCATPMGIAQRQTGPSFSTPQGANAMCYKGITGFGYLNLARDNRNAGGSPLTNLNGKYLYRPIFYGSLGPSPVFNFDCEGCTTLVSDPYRVESVQEGAMEFSGGTWANINKVYWSGSPILQPLWNFQGLSTYGTAGSPIGTAWSEIGASAPVNAQPVQNLNVQAQIQNQFGEAITFNPATGIPGEIDFLNQSNTITPELGGVIKPNGYNNDGYGLYDGFGNKIVDIHHSQISLPQQAAGSGLHQCLHTDDNGIVTGTGSDCGSGGGSYVSTLTTTQQTMAGPLIVPQVTSNTFAPTSVITYGDSITACWLVSNVANCYPDRLSSQVGGVLYNYGITGYSACDVMPNEIAPNGDQPIYSALQPMRTLMVGTNDANNKGAGAYESTFNTCMLGEMAWLATPLTSKVLGTTALGGSTGTCANDTEYATATGIKCTTAGSTFSLSITTTGGPIYIWPRYIDGDAGTWTYQLDSLTPVAVATNLSPAIATGASNTSDGATRLTGVSAGSHTVHFVQTGSSTSATMAITAIGTVNTGNVFQNPWLEVGPLINEKGGVKQTDVNAYRADTIADVQLLQADGLNIILAPTGPPPTGYVPATTAAGDMADTLHPNDTGHGELYEAFNAPLKLAPHAGGANTVLCVDGNFHTPCVVAIVHLTGLTNNNAGSINAPTLGQGFYRLSASVCVTTPGSAGTVSIYPSMNGGLVGGTVVTQALTATNFSCAQTMMAERNNNSLNIQATTIVAGNVGGVYTLDATLEYVAP